MDNNIHTYVNIYIYNIYYLDLRKPVHSFSLASILIIKIELYEAMKENMNVTLLMRKCPIYFSSDFDNVVDLISGERTL